MAFTMQLRNCSSRIKAAKSITSTKSVARRTLRTKPATATSSHCTAIIAPGFSCVWQEMRVKNQLCDGTVLCDDQIEFRIHRVILAAVSPYFRALFTNSLNNGRPDTTEAKVNVSSNIFRILLDYAYTGTCQINKSNAEQLLKYADQYEILGVVKLCCEYFTAELAPNNCLGILQIASRYFCNALIETAITFVRSKFALVLKQSNEFVHLNLIDLIALLTHDELNIKSEYVVFEAIIKWIGFDADQRRHHMLELVKCVRLSCLTNDDSNRIVEWIRRQNDLECQIYIDQTLQTITNIWDNTDMTREQFRPRIPHAIMFAIGGWTAGMPTNLIETYDIRADRWILLANKDVTCRAYHGLCTLKGLIYIIGGFDGNQYFNSVRCFDPITRMWSNCSCMQFPRCYISVVMCESRIYVMGGFNGRSRLALVEVYDSDRNQWKSLTSMQNSRSDASAAVVKNKIYIVGGFNGEEIMSSCEMFDTETNQWSYFCSMNSARSGVSLVAFGHTLYALGGYDGQERLTSCEKFVPEHSLAWVNVLPMITPRSNFASTIIDDYIYVVGGFNGTATISYVEYYDPIANTWFIGSSMNANRSALSACVVSGLANVKEYSVHGMNMGGIGQQQANNNIGNL